MGRTAKRVPINFNWPLMHVWGGYRNPYHVESPCIYCDWEDEPESAPCPEVQRLHDEWQETEPPEGPGWQLWETTSDGGPVSPVFISLEELCAWAETGYSIFADDMISAAEWRKFLAGDEVIYDVGGGMGVLVG